MSKTTTLLGYQPSHLVSKGLKVAIEWHVNKEVK
jgi:hypothetical protein